MLPHWSGAELYAQGSFQMGGEQWKDLLKQTDLVMKHFAYSCRKQNPPIGFIFYVNSKEPNPALQLFTFI